METRHIFTSLPPEWSNFSHLLMNGLLTTGYVIVFILPVRPSYIQVNVSSWPLITQSFKDIYNLQLSP